MSGLERLWAGWRTAYIDGQATGAAPQGGCVFCAIAASEQPAEETHLLWRAPGGTALAILNAYPYGSGHLMVMPARHVASPEDLTGEEGATLWQGVTAAVAAIRAAYQPDGLNIGANLGRAAGAGIPDHFHVHALPRWSGDTNFMTSVAETRVLPEPLDLTWHKLRQNWPGP